MESCRAGLRDRDEPRLLPPIPSCQSRVQIAPRGVVHDCRVAALCLLLGGAGAVLKVREGGQHWQVGRVVRVLAIREGLCL